MTHVIALRDAARILLAVAACATAAAPARSDALRLLDRDLALARAAPPEAHLAVDLRDHAVRPLLVAAAGQADQGASGKAAAAPSLDFDLLGEAPKPAAVVEDPSLRTRRTMLNLHQGFGIGLFALQLASTVTGQLNYNDKFGVDNTGRYKLTHKLVTYANLAAFAATGGIALFAPTEKGPKTPGFGRTTLHKLSMALATAGMISQGVLGVYTTHREGYLDQQKWGRAHLVIGYATLAVMSVGVGAIVF